MIRQLLVLLPLLSFLLSLPAFAEDSEGSDTDEEAYWDYGVGIGAVRFEHYPASDQHTVLALPAPTFQYRGKILRADDKDGAHLYLYKAETFTVELAGAGYPALNSSDNDAREGMEDLPWLIALGPELVSKKIGDNFELGLGVFQAITTDFRMTRFNGGIFQGRLTYDWNGDNITRKIGISAQGGSKEFQSIYFEVPTEDATPDRPAYEARDGFLEYALSFYQSYQTGKFSINFGGSLRSYDLSANSASPLHKANSSFNAFIGMNYVLGGSSRPEVPEDETSGVINSIRSHRREQQMRDSL